MIVQPRRTPSPGPACEPSVAGRVRFRHISIDAPDAQTPRKIRWDSALFLYVTLRSPTPVARSRRSTPTPIARMPPWNVGHVEMTVAGLVDH